MGQNTSHAVMAQRAEAHDSLDFFPTPLWATRALIEHVIIGNGWGRYQIEDMTAWEPAAAIGSMVKPLQESFAAVHASDVHDYGMGYEVRDFLFPGGTDPRADWIVTNPPFRLGSEFVLKALAMAREGVAMLVRTAFLEGGERYRTLYQPHLPLIVAPFVERVPMVKGRLDAKASTATSYAWIVWPGRDFKRIDNHTRTIWIPPCRKTLEREGDYE